MELATILVPLDGSALAEYALPYALRLTRAAGGRLVLVRAAPDAPTRQRAEAELAATASRLFTAGAQVESHVRRGAAGDVILDGARAWEAGLIVMATHGRSGLGRWLYGSVADHVLRRAEVPVLLVSGVCERRWPAPGAGAPAAAGAAGGAGTAPDGAGLGPVLVPLDGSGRSAAALRPAAALAGALGAGLLLTRVVPFPAFWAYAAGRGPYYPGAGPYAADTGPYAAGAGPHYATSAPDPEAELDAARRYLDGLATRLRPTGRDVATHVDLGPAAAAIARLARERDAAAIAMATHGRGGLARVALGSVATEVLRVADAPVLLVRPTALPGTVETADGPTAPVGDAAAEE
jgi:nucleotide-binding universal stress UspA family protein